VVDILVKIEDSDLALARHETTKMTKLREDVLEKHNQLLRDQIKRMRQPPSDIPFVACDHSCVITQPTGMSPNGGCRCDERKLRRAVLYWRTVAEHRQAIIQLMRDGKGEEEVVV
jgi:hypothetical protein